MRSGGSGRSGEEAGGGGGRGPRERSGRYYKRHDARCDCSISFVPLCLTAGVVIYLVSLIISIFVV